MLTLRAYAATVKTSPTTYGLLGLLAARSWTGYELTQQMRRSLRFVWSSSEGHLYREQKRLVELGWAKVVVDQAGGRSRNRYTITKAGERALRAWLSTPPQEPHFEVEGLLRVFFGDHGTVDDITNAMEATADAARSMLDEMLGFVDEYLAEGGPLWMLEHGVGGDDARLEFGGRPMFPERLHVVALVIDATTRLLADVETFARATADETRSWRDATDPRNTAATRARLEAVRARHS
jgi:DNA-binding PadR family transcriptional regulator